MVMGGDQSTAQSREPDTDHWAELSWAELSWAEESTGGAEAEERLRDKREVAW